MLGHFLAPKESIAAIQRILLPDSAALREQGASLSPENLNLFHQRGVGNSQPLRQTSGAVVRRRPTVEKSLGGTGTVAIQLSSAGKALSCVPGSEQICLCVIHQQ